MLQFYINLNCGFYDFSNNRTDMRLIRILQTNQWIQYLFYKNNISIINHNTSKLFSFLDACLKVSPIFFCIISFLQNKLQEKLIFHFFFYNSSSSNIISTPFSIITHTGTYSFTYLNVVSLNFFYGPFISLPFHHSLTCSVPFFHLAL